MGFSTWYTVHRRKHVVHDFSSYNSIITCRYYKACYT
nr:MAG TPA: hypothetical protein [Caudoviricetes sp.]